MIRDLKCIAIHTLCSEEIFWLRITKIFFTSCRSSTPDQMTNLKQQTSIQWMPLLGTHVNFSHTIRQLSRQRQILSGTDMHNRLVIAGRFVWVKSGRRLVSTYVHSKNWNWNTPRSSQLAPGSQICRARAPHHTVKDSRWTPWRSKPRSHEGGGHAYKQFRWIIDL